MDVNPALTILTPVIRTAGIRPVFNEILRSTKKILTFTNVQFSSVNRATGYKGHGCLDPKDLGSKR